MAVDAPQRKKKTGSLGVVFAGPNLYLVKHPHDGYFPVWVFADGVCQPDRLQEWLHGHGDTARMGCHSKPPALSPARHSPSSGKPNRGGTTHCCGAMIAKRG